MEKDEYVVIKHGLDRVMPEFYNAYKLNYELLNQKVQMELVLANDRLKDLLNEAVDFAGKDEQVYYYILGEMNNLKSTIKMLERLLQ